jgi:hypothetical protein
VRFSGLGGGCLVGGVGGEVGKAAEPLAGVDEDEGAEAAQLAKFAGLTFALGLRLAALLAAVHGSGDAEGPALFEEDRVEVGVGSEEAMKLIGETSGVGIAGILEFGILEFAVHLPTSATEPSRNCWGQAVLRLSAG